MAGGDTGLILAKGVAIAKKDWLSAVRYRNGLLLNIFSPALQLLTFYYLARAVGPQYQPEGMPYFTFLLVGTGFYTFLLGSMYAFLHAVQEAQQTGTLEVLMTTATEPKTLLCLSGLSGSASGLMQSVLYILTGFVLFPATLHVHVAGALAVVLLSAAITISLGMFAAAMQVSTQKGSWVVWALGAGASLITGTLFPTRVLPNALYFLSQCLPITHAITAMRLAIAGGDGLVREIGTLLGFTALLLPSSLAFFSWSLRRARQAGALSFY
jgi:ABC-type polysaccharide/polyol phosphate export permease